MHFIEKLELTFLPFLHFPLQILKKTTQKTVEISLSGFPGKAEHDFKI